MVVGESTSIGMARSGRIAMRRRRRVPWLFPLLWLGWSPAGAAEAPVLPSSILTPGEADPSLTAAVICNTDTKHRRHVTAATRDSVFSDYNVAPADHDRYELDHLIPLALGGTNRAANLWPQESADAALKDVLEVEMQRRVCHGLLPLPQAQHEIADDWYGAYQRYVLGSPEALQAGTGAAPKLSDRLKAAARRLYHLWKSGSD